MAEPLLKIEHLTKRYGDDPVLDDLSLDVHKGEVIVILGPSGCGKSTLLRCVNALEEIQGGSVTLEGQPISKNSKNLTELRQKIGMVFQSYDLFPHLNVLDNILLAPMKVQKRKKEEVTAEAMELLERVGLKEKAKNYPRELSGGQKQRVAIARTLMMKAPILVFDDSLSAVDAETDAKIRHALKAEMEKATVLLISHRINSLKQADLILVMDKGKICELGTHEELISQEGIYKDIYEIQMNSDIRVMEGGKKA